MPKITIDDLEYNTEDLSEKGVAQLASLQFVDQTAQRSYAGALKAEIEELGIYPVEGTDDE